MNSRKGQLSYLINTTCLLMLSAACSEYKVLGEELQTTGGTSATNTTQNTAVNTGGTSGTTGVETGASSSIGGTTSTGRTYPLSTSTDPRDGTCPLVSPSTRVYYPGEANSPCPPVPPSTADVFWACDVAHLTSACLYGSWPDIGLQEIATCSDVGMNTYEWTSHSERCVRRGSECLEGFDGTSGAVEITNVTSDCSTRAMVACDPTDNHTSQTALDMQITSIVKTCAGAVLGAGQPASLSVWFGSGCATGFYVYPISLKECVKQILENERYDCGVGSVGEGAVECAASGKVGRCDLC